MSADPPSPPPLKGTPKEAIKDSGPQEVTADDDAEIEQAIEEGSKTDEIMTKAKVKTKSHVLGAFKGIGKKMAACKGDVAVDGTQKVVSLSAGIVPLISGSNKGCANEISPCGNALRRKSTRPCSAIV